MTKEVQSYLKALIYKRGWSSIWLFDFDMVAMQNVTNQYLGIESSKW